MKTAAKRTPSYIPWLTTNDLAALMRVDPQTIRVWARNGQIPPPRRIGNGRSLRWAPSDLKSLVGEREEG